jgi:hypothetical protein
MQQLTGSFIGSAGEWGDAFELAGCCDVVIPCHSDCVFLRGCGDDQIAGRVSNRSKTIVLEKENVESIQVEYLIETTKQNTNTALDEIITRSTIKGTKLNNVSDVSIYPNPIGDDKYLSVILDPKCQITKINVFDINGSLVEVKINLEKNTAKIDVEHLNDGIYVLVIEDEKSQINLQKFIKL